MYLLLYSSGLGCSKEWIMLSSEVITLQFVNINKDQNQRDIYYTSQQTVTLTNVFAAFRVLMLQVCFKQIIWYIEMHPVKTFFLYGIIIFSYYAMFIHMLIFKRKAYHGFFLPYNCQHGQCLSAQDKYDQDKFGVIFSDKMPGKLSS